MAKIKSELAWCPSSDGRIWWEQVAHSREIVQYNLREQYGTGGKRVHGYDIIPVRITPIVPRPKKKAKGGKAR